jgi:death on curing protein
MFKIEDFLLAAEAVLEIDTNRLAQVTNIPLAESALAAPYASFAGHDRYPDPLQRAAVLASRIMRNHPLPDGNKRVALILTDIYLDEHRLTLVASAEEIDQVFRGVAARSISETSLVEWLTARTRFDEPRGLQALKGVWKGKVELPDDFDELPDDIQRAFGMIDD